MGIARTYRILSLTIVFVFGVLSPDAHGQLGGSPGAFSRMGFGARGIAMGNAMTTVTTGDIVGYYNPALLPWTQYRHGSVSAAFLSLDRTLNFLSYTQSIKPRAGISAGIINAGVSKIDGRDSDGEPTGPLRTSENQVFLGFGVRPGEKLSIGINFKLHYYHLYTDVSSTTIGIDAGVLLTVNPSVTLGATVRDIGSKYKWDTSKLYGQSGSKTDDAFPRLYTLGASFSLPDSMGLVAAEVELSSARTFLARAGVEMPILQELSVRAGVDRMDLKEKGKGIKPSFGFTARTDFEDWSPALHYAFVLEPFSPSGMHILSLSVVF